MSLTFGAAVTLTIILESTVFLADAFKVRKIFIAQFSIKFGVTKSSIEKFKFLSTDQN